MARKKRGPSSSRRGNPHELRRARFEASFVGFEPTAVRRVLVRAAATIERLEGNAAAAPGTAPISPAELRDADFPEMLRGYNRESVRRLCARAADTIATTRAQAPVPALVD